MNVDKALLGTLCVVGATMASRLADHQYLSPLFFSLGIVLIIIFNLSLVTRDIPGGKPFKECLATLAVNIGVAELLGVASPLTLTSEMRTDIYSAMATGIIIGWVSLVNKKDTPYKVPATFLLMYIFVYLKLPHCVVMAFYNAPLPVMVAVTAGNIFGGLFIRTFAMPIELYFKEDSVK